MADGLFFKQVKPARMRDEAIRLALLNAAHKAARDITRDFKATTKTWEHKVDFQSQVSLKGGPTVLVGTDDEIYGYVNDGTPEHDIQPKNSRYLVYRVGYKAKTAPGVIGSSTGGKYGKYTKRKQVHHPGIGARKFDAAISKKWKVPFKRLMEQALADGAAKSGHGVK